MEALAFVLLIGLALALVRWRKALGRADRLAEELATERKSLATEKTNAESRIASLSQQLATLHASVTRLARFENVANADDEAARLVRDARTEVERLKKEADEVSAASSAAIVAMRMQAEGEAAALRADAKQKIAKATAQADAARAAATGQAKVIIDEANRKAEAMAGDALRALREADELERTVRALENVINGYGDRYIVPSHSVLDELAEAYGHVEAGQQLKAVRERVREAVQAGEAATCDYVEENRRGTAERFVTDAFNGKADSILSRVRIDNCGTLRQELRDAYTLVNQNGKAFRNARVIESYLNLRIEELEWATAVHVRKEEERAEQRRLREQIKEEEKARREFERAMKEAAREEEIVRKAMAKAQEQLARATEEQRAKCEVQLAELQSRLNEAEQENQRALSMAQQTKRGNVYVISNEGSFGDGVYKIGLTRRLDPQDRIRELGDSSVPFEFDVHAFISVDDAPALECQLHRNFVLNQVNKVNYRKEFFRVSLADIRAQIEKLGLTATWTMTAAAREYRESLAIDKAIASDPVARESWLKRQLVLDPTDGLPVEELESAAV